jgi:hypothetical protein
MTRIRSPDVLESFISLLLPFRTLSTQIMFSWKLLSICGRSHGTDDSLLTVNDSISGKVGWASIVSGQILATLESLRPYTVSLASNG